MEPASETGAAGEDTWSARSRARPPIFGDYVACSDCSDRHALAQNVLSRQAGGGPCSVVARNHYPGPRSAFRRDSR